MAVEVIFPRVDMDMQSGKITQWFARDGETVEKGSPLFEIETDKAAMEIEAPASGILRAPSIERQDDVPVGTPVAWILAPDEPWSPREPETAVPAPAREIASPSAASQVDVPGPDGSTRATPLARREAARNGLAIASVKGSGPKGRVKYSDVLDALAKAPAAPVAREPEQTATHVLRSDAPASATGELHRQRSGPASGTPIVLLHGFGSEVASWRDVTAILDTASPVIAIDLPGHGRSPAGAATHSAIVDAVIATLRRERIERFHLAGHSLGGAVALGVADVWPGAIASLCLIAPAGLGPEIDAAFLAGFVAARQTESLAPWLRRLFADPAIVTDGFIRATLRAQETEGRRDAQRALIANLFPDGTQALSLSHVLERISVPVKVIWGEADAIIPPRHAAGLAGHVALHRLRGVGHMPQVEAPGLVARLLSELARSG